MNIPAKALLLLILLFVGLLNIKAQPGCPHFRPEHLVERFAYVFVGKAVAKKPAEGSIEHFSVQVLENFKGMENQSTAVAYKYFDGCTDQFEVGGTYLFAAEKDENGYLRAWSYSGSPGWRQQREYIEILRWKKSAPQTGLMVGKVLLENYSYKNGPQKPFNVDKVFLQNEAGVIYETKIENEGYYRFDNVRPGNYMVFLNLPKGLTGNNVSPARRENVAINNQAAQMVNFLLIFDSSISGKITNTGKEPLTSMNVWLYKIDSKGKESDVSLTQTNAEGRYSFEEVAPGRYIILTYPIITIERSYGDETAIDAKSGYPVTYFPNASKRSEARKITLQAGEAGAADISVRSLDQRLIEGRVFYPDNVPAANIEIVINIFRSLSSKQILSAHDYQFLTKTDAGGHFSFSGYESTKYKIQAEARQTYRSWSAPFASECVELPSHGKIRSLIITLESRAPGCSDDYFKYPF